MIPLQFGLFWSGSKLSYLRYLTFKTLRHFHPESSIMLFVAKKYKKDGHHWHREQQEFEDNRITIDYLPQLKSLDVEVKELNAFPQYNPNFQSDFFRYWYLKSFGGFYLDTDQIILKSFESLPLNNELIYSHYHNPQCGMYTPVGVLGMPKDSKIASYVMSNIGNYFNPDNYNSIGPFMFIDAIKKVDMSNTFNAPASYFYPAFHSDLVPLIYNGSLRLTDESYALHLFLGHPISQAFNKHYTEEFAKSSNDTVSRWLREQKLL